MPQREMLVRDIHKALMDNEFAVSDPRDLAHAGFDLVARKDSLILIVKVASNASSLNSQAVAGMMTLTGAVDGSPLLVALKSGKESLEDGVMYTRAGIALLSPQTFYDLIVEGVPPLVYAAGGGYYVNIDSEMLKKARQGGVTLGEMAEMGGVSRRTIKMYEDGMSAKLEVAIRLEERMGIELIQPADPFIAKEQKEFAEVEPEGLAREIFHKLHDIGYTVQKARACPFDAVTLDRNTVLFTGIGQKTNALERRAKAISNLGKILEKHSVIFVDRRGQRMNLEGIPIIGCGELNKAKNRKMIMDMIEERL